MVKHGPIQRVYFAFLLISGITLPLNAQSQSTGAPLSFNKDIRPVLNTCFRCHGPDPTSRMAGMRLDLPDEATKPRQDGTPIVPGHPEQSLVIQRIFETNAARRMPPQSIHKDLTEAQKEMIRGWVTQGALYEPNWAYAPVKRPAVPELKSSTVLNPIDAFIQTRLAQAGLKPSPEADRRTLIRRVTLDLTGLAPTPDEVAAYVADKSPDAYEKVVDRLMVSPRYAEKQALHWLDAVRFADTSGYHGDNAYPTWPFRDYVLRAFQNNKPFDQFTIEQLAGDLLPNPTTEQKIASAYNRLNRVSAEGGIQAKEYLARYGADRVRNLSAVWFASTVGCAECHDHKFDPIKQKDFYAMKAFFADIKEDGIARDSQGAYSPDNWGVKLALPTPEQNQSMQAITSKLANAQQALDNTTDSLSAEQKQWEKEILTRYDQGDLKWQFQHPVSATARGATLTVRDELQIRIGSYLRDTQQPVTGMVVASGANPDTDVYTITLKPGAGTWKSLGLELERDDTLAGSNIGRGATGVVFSEIEADLLPAPKAQSRKVSFSLAHASGGAGRGGAGRGGASDRGDGRAPNNVVAMRAISAVDGDPKTAWFVMGGTTSAANPFVALHFAEPVQTTADSRIIVKLRQESDTRRATAGRFRVALSGGTAWPDETSRGGTVDVAEDPGGKTDDKKNWGLPDNLVEALRLPQEKRTDAQKGLVRAYFEEAEPRLVPLWVNVAKLESAKEDLDSEITRVMVAEATEPKETRILPHGNWMDDSGELVEPAIPGFLGKLDTGGKRATRLDLAKWLVSAQNPLTARAIVNRMWKDFFGTGISKQLEDFGSQGEWPSNPDLLDWLAAEFVQPEFRASGTHAWDMKHIVRTIVTSYTYRQSSLPTPEIDERDPDNRLLARQSRFRVDAEVVHDVALQVSGLLVEKFGGPSVKPYEPPGYLAAMNYPRREYSADHGDAQYRRAVYTFVQRTFPHPDLLAFDAPTREECTLDRVNSNTPLQALDLLDDPIYVEAARVFAENVLRKGGPSVSSQLTWAFRQALGRQPDNQELAVLTDLHTRSLTRFQKDRKGADAFIHTGESPVAAGSNPASLAAMTAVTRVVLNLSELITRD